jgi:LPPG:FO 2-phospho-L-lactate transferase
MKLTALAGGVGAAKLLSGMAAVLPPEELTVIVNTGDDFLWHGLHVSPDLDTIVYALAGIAGPTTGWGVRNDTFHCLDRLGRLGAETWFRVGDQDLATHIFRTHRLQQGDTLSEVTAAICRGNGLVSRILPMTDSFVPTMVETAEGVLAFQDYFVRRSWAPRVLGFCSEGIETSAPAPGVIAAIHDADAVVLCPSNPYVSVAPILSVPGVREALRSTAATVAAVSPIVAGEALKGPAAEMLRQLGHEVSAVSVASFYSDFLDAFVLDRSDEHLAGRVAALGVKAWVTCTVMDTPESRAELARFLLEALP